MSQRVLRVALAGMLAAALGCSDDPGSLLTTTSPIAPGATCPAGGTRVVSGIDADGNGVLGSDEVETSRDVCFTVSPSSPSSIVDVADEPAGEHCAHGGRAIRSGIDDNADGVLGATEIDRTDYACAAAPDVDVVTRTRPERPGSRCASGGTLVESGPDVDGDDTLDDDEVTRTDVVCQVIPDVLVRVDVEPAGGNCHDGGSAVRAGYDLDGNRVLGASEIRTTSYVCSDAPTDVLVRIDTTAPTAGCPIGGHVVRSGRDDDHDRVLDDSEIERTDVACYPGALLTRTADEPIGPNCAHGGTVYLTGRDDDGDNVLDDDEVDSRSYVCLADPAVHVGDATIRYDSDLQALVGKQRIIGTLTISRTGVTELPNLVEVGSLYYSVYNSEATIRLPRLESARYFYGYGEVAEVSAPALQHGSVSFDRHYTLRRLDVGAADSLTINECPNLTDVTVRGSRAGTVAIRNNRLLARLDAPALTEVGALHLAKLPVLARVPWLSSVTSFGRLSLDDLAAITEVAAPQVSSMTSFAARTVPQLTTIRLPALASAEHVEINGAPRLATVELAPTVELDELTLVGAALMQRLPSTFQIRADGSVLLSGNRALRDLDALRVNARLGSVTVTSHDALTSLGTLTTISSAGELVVTSNRELTALSFPQLRTVAGALRVEDNQRLTELAVPRLDNVGAAGETAAFVVQRNPLAGLDLQALTYARNLTVSGLRAGVLDLRRLAEVTGALEVRDNPELTSIDLSTLAHVGTALTVTANRDLAAIDIDQLATVGGALTVTVNAALGALGLPDLTRVGGAVDVAANGALTSIDIDRLASVGGAFNVDGHAQLTAIAATALTEIAGDLRVTDNPRLAQCRALALRAQLRTLGGNAFVFGNDSGATCP